MKWIGNTLILSDRSLLTVKDGNLELRGEGWDRRKKGDTENTDLVRVCSETTLWQRGSQKWLVNWLRKKHEYEGNRHQAFLQESHYPYGAVGIYRIDSG